MKNFFLSLSLISYCGYAYALGGMCGTLNVTIVNNTNIPLMIKLSEVDSAADYGVNNKDDTEIFSAVQSGNFILLNTKDTENALPDSIKTERTIALYDPVMFDGPSIRIQAFWEYQAYLKYKYPLLCDQDLEHYSLCNPNPFADNLRLTTLYDFTVHRNATVLEAGSVYVKKNSTTESTVHGYNMFITADNGSCEDDKVASLLIELWKTDPAK